MVRYVPISSSTFSIESVLVPSYGVRVSAHSQNQVSSNPSHIVSVPATSIHDIPKSSTDSNLIVQPQQPASQDPSLNIHPMQARSKTQSLHALTTTISDDCLSTITEPSNIHEHM